MLGLRRYKNTQIDLWTGDATQFAVDALLPWVATTDDNLHKQLFSEALDRRVRHVAIHKLSTDATSHVHTMAAQATMQALREFLDGLDSSPRALARVTFITQNLVDYETMQTALFKVFEDSNP